MGENGFLLYLSYNGVAWRGAKTHETPESPQASCVPTEQPPGIERKGMALKRHTKQRKWRGNKTSECKKQKE